MGTLRMQSRGSDRTWRGRTAAMDDEDLERVRGVVAAIPVGSVLAYGEVAARAGLPGRARLVGRILAEDGRDLPWHRVLRADGTPASHLAAEQLARLRAEGVLAEGGRVPMCRYRATAASCDF
jgi:methylated-DNA-protein-cysteine methyltransferase related protein